jgi:hypothetical protein
MDQSCTAGPTRRLLGLAMFLSCAASVTWAQGEIDEQLMQRYGGVLAPQCGNYLLPQLLYLGDSLVVRDGGQPVLTGRHVKAMPAYFGTTPPPEFETALTSEVASGAKLVFVFYRTDTGLFAAVEGGADVMAQVPAALKGKRIRHCDPNRNAVPGTTGQHEIGPDVLLQDDDFKRAYVRALGPLSEEPWLMQLDGPAQPVRSVQIGGTAYQLVSVCKNHDCYDNNVVVLYAAATRTVYAKVLQGGRPILLGAPPPPVAAELERLWTATYRGGG